ncbi:MAG: anti-sigma factor [Pseudomonadota bacterium]
MRYEKPEVQDRLARDYVMGVLCDAARRRCHLLRRQIPALDQRIYYWEEHLQPMADAVPSLAPSAQLWRSIDASITTAPAQRSPSLWSRLSFLRGFAVAASVVAMALVFVQLSSGPAATVDYVAVLAGSDGDARFVVTASDQTRQMDIKVFGNPLATDADYQLWAVSKTDGEIRSLGLLNANASSQRALNETDWRLVGDAHELLVTAEMTGGSAIGEPSDVVISRGLCIRLSDG